MASEPEEEENTSGAETVVIDATSHDGKSEWTLRLEDEWIRGDAASTDSGFAIQRREFSKRASLVDGLLVARLLSVKKPKTALRLEPSAFRSLKDWIGQAVLLRMILKQRMGFAMAIGGALIILALPMAGDASAGIEDSPFQPLLAALGAVLLLEGVLAWWRPHMHLLLVDSGFFVCIGAWTIYDVVGGATLYWVPLGAFQFWLGYTGLRDWRRFRKGAY